MKLFGLNITRSAPSTTDSQPSTRSLTPAAVAWLRGDDVPHNGGIPLRNAYEQITWVYRAATVLAEQIANIPFRFSHGERGREQSITSGPLIDFYNQPNKNIDRFQYWELRVLWLLLRGECFRIPIFEDPLSSALSSSSVTSPNNSLSASGGEGWGEVATYHTCSSYQHSIGRRLKRVLILNPDNFSAIIENHELVGWRYTGNPRLTPVETQTFLPEEVWHDRLPNPFNHWRGMSPLLSADLAVKTDLAAASFMRGYIENNADNGLIVRTNEQLDDVQRELILAALRNRKRSAGTADRPLLLSSSCEVIQPRLSSADLQFLENRKFSRAEICAALGVPEEIVCTTDHNKYDVMQGARLNFIENRVAPLCARLEAAEQVTVHAIDSKAIGWFDLENLPIMQQARRDRLSTAKIGFDMGIPFNELNRLYDLGFPRLPWGDTGYIQGNLVPAGIMPPPPPPPQAPAEPPQGSGRSIGTALPTTPPPRAKCTADQATELLQMAREFHAIIKS